MLQSAPLYDMTSVADVEIELTSDNICRFVRAICIIVDASGSRSPIARRKTIDDDG
jgi:hypothetical protein